MKTGTIILARMESNRFPGKAIAPLFGRPVIAWLIDKGKDLGTDEVIVATSYEDADDAIERVCEDEGCRCFRGHPQFIAGRQAGAFEAYDLTHAMHFSGDSPFIDINAAGLVLEHMIAEPMYDTYTAAVYNAGMLGIQCSGHARTYYDKMIPLIEEDPDFPRYQQTTGHFEAKYGGLISTRTIKVPGIFHPYVTPINLCVDYPLQLAILNQVCEKLGAFPYDYRDIEEFYATHSEL